MYSACVRLCKHTFDIKCLGVAELALVLHRDLALVISRVDCPGWVDLIVSRVFCGVGCVDFDVIPFKLEKVFQMRNVAGTDACVATNHHLGSTLNIVFRQD